MGSLAVVEAVAGGLLIFVVPGFTIAKAVFPERRLATPEGVRWAIELAALSLVLSVVLTVVVGYVLLVGAPGGFSATWSDPLLETVLAAIALVAFVGGLLQGAYARDPRPSVARPEEAGTVGAAELSRQLDRLQRDRRRLERELRGSPDATTAASLRARLGAVTDEEAALRRQREADYDL